MQRKRADIFNKRMTLAVTLKIVRTNIVSLVIADFFLEAPCKTNGSRCSRASMRDAARGAIKCNSSTVNLFVSLWQRIFGATKRRIVSFHPSAIVTFQVCREAGEQKETGRQRHLSAETIKTLSADVFLAKRHPPQHWSWSMSGAKISTRVCHPNHRMIHSSRANHQMRKLMS